MAGKVASSHAEAERAAQQIMAGGGNCVDAVIAAFLGAGAVDDGVLLAPLALLVAGVGRGARIIDGRALQPGSGQRRPRGIVSGQKAPAAAFAGVPRSFGALALAHAYGAGKSLSALIRPAVAAAQKAGAPARAALLSAFASRGARVLQSSEILRQLLLVAGPAAGGTLSEQDIAAAAPGEDRAHLVAIGSELFAALAPWQLATPAVQPADGSRRAARRPADIAVAADAAGSVAALAWAADPEGVPVAGLEVRLPCDGAPVRRGVARVRPGSPRPADLPIAVLIRSSDGWFAALGASARPDLAASEIAAVGLPELLAALADTQRGACAIAATVARGKPQLVRVAGRR